MSNTLLLVLRRKAVAVFVATLLLGSVSAAAPLDQALDADILHYNETFYSDATYSVTVGTGNGYCEGDYVMTWGYATAYSRSVYRNPCP